MVRSRSPADGKIQEDQEEGEEEANCHCFPTVRQQPVWQRWPQLHTDLLVWNTDHLQSVLVKAGAGCMWSVQLLTFLLREFPLLDFLSEECLSFGWSLGQYILCIPITYFIFKYSLTLIIAYLKYDFERRHGHIATLTFLHTPVLLFNQKTRNNLKNRGGNIFLIVLEVINSGL